MYCNGQTLLLVIQGPVAPVVDARANGERPDETDPVLELLSAVVGIPAFGLPQLAKFREWAAAIERPKRRRMRPVSYFEGDTKLGRDDEMFVQDALSSTSSEEDDIDAAVAELALMTPEERQAEAARKAKELRRREATELAQLNRSRTDERQGEKKARVEARQKAMKQYQKLFKFPGRKVLLCSSDRTTICSLSLSKPGINGVPAECTCVTLPSHEGLLQVRKPEKRPGAVLGGPPSRLYHGHARRQH